MKWQGQNETESIYYTDLWRTLYIDIANETRLQPEVYIPEMCLCLRSMGRQSVNELNALTLHFVYEFHILAICFKRA
jgi:hypothetical protein